MTFNEINCSDNTRKALDDLGFVDMTPIQEKAIPVISEGKDVIGLAQTGTGKTAAFSIPAIENIEVNEKYPQILIVCPTRELALQVSGEVEKFIKYERGLQTVTIYGGVPIQRQMQQLRKGPQIIVGTPGRLLDHIKRKTLKIGMVNTVILDEADEMLNMGFREDIESILDKVDENRQTLLFSATMSKQIRSLTNKYLTNPVTIEIERKSITSANIVQKYINVNEKDKIEIISRIMEIENPKLSIVFCNTKKSVDEVVGKLQKKGYVCDRIHGDIQQAQRSVVMDRFKRGHFDILVATDVVARGIDVNDVEMVFNYDVPQENEYYVHRIGRTGRAGNTGQSITLVNRRDNSKLREISRYIKSDIAKADVPSIDEVKKIKLDKFLTGLEADLSKEDEFADILAALQEKDLSEYDVYKVIAAFFKNEFKGKYLVEISEPKAGDRGSRGRDRDRDSRGRGRDRDRAGDRGRSRSRSSHDGPTQRIFLSLGTRDGIRKGDIVGAVAGESRIDGSDILEIDILQNFSFIEVTDSVADKVVSAMNGNTIKGRKVSFEIAKKRK